ncbi:hypothetical protein N7G274_007396 [Stereocaulon virgatum]|uniref:Uncharacterized protein n=1 Tax=Stereocaulon virgatum TaxID=373712 RepID=A0ABR4A4J2_9LECA
MQPMELHTWIRHHLLSFAVHPLRTCRFCWVIASFHAYADREGHGLQTLWKAAKNSTSNLRCKIIQVSFLWSTKRHGIMPPQGARSLNSASANVNNYSAHEKHIQQVLAATFASISVIAGFVAFYWFARMKRSFRHHLIMLLVASNMWKAIWYFVPAILILTDGPPISHDFCQGGGFMLAVGLEGADFVILLIAIHTALIVLRPGKITQKSGLFPYQCQAYICWAAFSILLAGLAFLNGHANGYISQGTFCTLPVRPIWYRLALSWVPRYLILITVLAIYVAIYIYTKFRFGEFDTDFSSNSHASADRSQSNSSEGGPRPQPASTDKHLQRTSSEHLAVPAGITPEKDDKLSKRRPLTHSSSWPKYSFGRCKPRTFMTFHGMIPRAIPKSHKVDPSIVLPRQSTEHDTNADIVFKTPTLMEALRDKSLSALAINPKAREPQIALRKRHKAVKRQLRYMFVYPIVYLVMWFPPFVNHCYFYTKAHNPPFALNCFALCFLLLQCAVDCLVFCCREKPWRHATCPRKRSEADAAVHTSGNTVTDLTEKAEGVTLAQGQVATIRNFQGLQSSPTSSPRRERFWFDEEGL